VLLLCFLYFYAISYCVSYKIFVVSCNKAPNLLKTHYNKVV